MESSLPNGPLFLSFILISSTLNLLPLSSAANPTPITYHNGPLLTGNVDLAMLWYGQLDGIQKEALGTFIESLNNDRDVSFEPRVSDWWNMVESYQVVANKKLKKSPKIKVKVVRQVDDAKYSVGKALSSGSYPGLVKKATGGLPNTVAVIFTGKEVEVENSCSGTCYLHGVLGKQVYIVVGNPIKECPKKCAWPFHALDYGFTVRPPTSDPGADAMIVHFASALATTVTNPYSTGFFGGAEEAGTACKGVFGPGAFPGYTGRVRLDPHTNVGFNAHGLNHSKFLVPAVWDPKKSSCWTTL